MVCIDDPGARDLLAGLSRRVVTYGCHADADYRLENYRADGLSGHFDLIRADGRPPLALTVRMPGLHNALNAAGAAAMCGDLQVDDGAITRGLADFGGVGRRFSDLGEVAWAGGTAQLIDDYGHHPTEVVATLQAARAAFTGRRVVMVYQPHRYTRTRDHFDDFVSVLSEGGRPLTFCVPHGWRTAEVLMGTKEVGTKEVNSALRSFIFATDQGAMYTLRPEERA